MSDTSGRGPQAQPDGGAARVGGTAGDQPAARPPRSARHQFAATILGLEAFLVLFATLVAHGLRLAPVPVVWGVGGSLAVAMLLVAGMLRWPAGYWAGSALQAPMLAVGLAVPTMLLVGGIFVLLWVAALRLGSRIDRERAERLTSSR